MSSDSQNWTALDLRKALVRKASQETPGAPPESLSAPTRRLAVALADYVYYYDSSDPDVADNIEEDRMYQLMMTRLEAMTAWDATRSGDVSSMRGIAGAQGRDRLDLSSWQAIDELEGLWDPDDRDSMLNLMLYAPLPPEGPTGVGKTDFAYSVIEAGQRAYPGLSVASNNTSDPFADVQSWSELEEWLGVTDGVKAFLLDEAAQVLQYADMNEGKALSKLIKLLRKYNCHLIVVAHTGKDIPKDIRRMVLLCRKESKKKATIGVGLDEVNGDMQIDRELLKLEGIPPTRIDFESIDDKGEFVFDAGDDGNEEGQNPQCEATTNEGTPCPNDAKFPQDAPRVCVNHRHKLGDLDADDEE